MALRRMHTFLSGKPAIALTMGDAAGIGAEVILKALSDRKIKDAAEFLVIGESYIFKILAARLKIKVPRGIWRNFIDCGYIPKGTIAFGRINREYATASLGYIRRALKAVSEGAADAIVTAPVNKAAVNAAGIKWRGHTEMMARYDKCDRFAMMLIGGPLRVALVTTHIPLKKVAKEISAERICEIISLVNSSLRRYFGVARPRLAVASLNPHAGEGGFMGDEERRIIMPAIRKASRRNIRAAGPLSSEALFYSAYRGKYDAAVCMYHDQGLAPLKMLAEREGVNVTLGLSFIRTSPSHGTAFDIAGKGKADAASMKNAIRLAAEMVKRDRRALD